jgi:hypothetical protein
MNKSATNVSNKVNEAGQVARGAATNHWMLLLARCGYGAKGVVYLIIGLLAIQLSLGAGGSATDQHGALMTISQQPFGKFLLVIVAIGLLGFALWSLIQAIFDTEGEGKKAKGIVTRLGYAVVGISYAILAFGAIRLVLGSGNGGRGSTASAQDWTAILLKQPFGVALVILLGLVVIGVAGSLFYKAYAAKFQYRLNLATLDARMKKAVIAIGRAGYSAQGVVLFIVGVFFIIAALQDNASKAKGLDSALQALSHQPFGQLLLGIVALGLFAYGVYSCVEARYRRLGGARRSR